MSVVKNSAMRFSLFIVSLSVALAVIGIVFYIVMKTLNKQEPAWSEMGVFITGLAALITGSGWNKTKQKEIEVKNENK